MIAPINIGSKVIYKTRIKRMWLEDILFTDGMEYEILKITKVKRPLARSYLNKIRYITVSVNQIPKDDYRFRYFVGNSYILSIFSFKSLFGFYPVLAINPKIMIL